MLLKGTFKSRSEECPIICDPTFIPEQLLVILRTRESINVYPCLKSPRNYPSSGGRAFNVPRGSGVMQRFEARASRPTRAKVRRSGRDAFIIIARAFSNDALPERIADEGYACGGFGRSSLAPI